MPANIPVEVSEHVIDMLWDDKDTLRACALTCRAWVPRSRLYLFRSITLRERPTVYALADLLDTDESIQHLIQTVGVKLDKHTLLLDSFFAVLGRRLPRLHELSFTGRSLGRPFFPHITRRTCLLASFTTSIASLSLQSVILRSFNDLARLLCTLRHLRHLNLNHTTWLNDGTYSSKLITSHGLKLETLRVTSTFGPTPCVRTMLCAVDPAILKEIALDSCCGLGIAPPFEWIPVDLQEFSALENLSIYIEDILSPSTGLEAAVAVLSSVTSSALRRVYIDGICLRPAKYERPAMRKSVSDDLRAALSRPVYAKLEEVCLRVGDFDRGLVAAFVSCFPQFCERGVPPLEVYDSDTGISRFVKECVRPDAINGHLATPAYSASL
ncbi:hypothetical protein K466DRAFT_605658 [Polyporus arcularius HHB13444]|uniref:F-box domain-containing protein n=1 Tax=Polyporus arcularius HHB13444 TaxID=1314778 RepID=A0A5C3NRU0_9APHY|nr:hypothetical protein K466DRAFT_605658 [Polyporus arcularius HHB13444]